MQPGMKLLQTRVLKGSTERVFRALTEPAELAKWFGPRGFQTRALSLDLRVGGHFRLAMQPPDGAAFRLEGEYRELRAPHRLAFTFRWDPPDADDRETLATLSLADGARPGTTELRLEHVGFVTEPRRALHDDGWKESLDRLEALLSAEK